MVKHVLVVGLAAAMLCACPQSFVQFPIAGCDAGLTACGDAGVCADLQKDKANCGMCGKACAANESCKNAVCTVNDPCAALNCSATQFCDADAGVCRGKCDVVVCNAGFVCEMNTGSCISCTLSDAGTLTDVNNCGACGNQCTDAGLHTTAACKMGVCGRTACEANYYDFEPSIGGCETLCNGTVCTLFDGGTVTLSSKPVHEAGGDWQTASSGSSYGSAIQTSPGYTNYGTLGEPPPAAGSVQQTGGNYKNAGGFGTMLQKK